ncbi:MAG: hypothetical protein M3P91_03915 [Actinomycetota bacterium]|nr:hypothetical protein [Actinomycetota bacterium]
MLLSSGTRLERQALWSMITFLLEGLVFLLIGLRLPAILDELAGRPIEQLAVTAGAVTATVILARFLYIFPTGYLLPLLGPRMRARGARTVVAIAHRPELGRHARRGVAGGRLRPADRHART